MAETLKVPFFKGTYGEEEVEAVRKVLRSGWLTSGPVVRELEEAVRQYVKSKHVVAMNSCTSALLLSFRALMPKNRPWRAILPAWTFLATANAVENAGGRCVFVDSEPESLNVDLDAVERVLEGGSGPTVIVPVHFNGNPVDMNRVCVLAKKYGAVVVEDCAHAFGSVLNVDDGGPGMFGEILKHVGTFGRAGCFSLYTTKNISSGEGDLLVTDDAQFAETVRTMARFGQPVAAIDRLEKGLGSHDPTNRGLPPLRPRPHPSPRKPPM